MKQISSSPAPTPFSTSGSNSSHPHTSDTDVVMAQVLGGAVGGGETAAAASGVSDPSAASTRPPAGFAARKAYSKTHPMNSVKASVLGLLQGNDARKRIVLRVIEDRVKTLTSIWVQATRLVNLLVMQCLEEGTDPPAITQELVRQCLCKLWSGGSAARDPEPLI